MSPYTLELELKAMALDHHSGEKIRQIVHVVRAQPVRLVYSLNNEQQAVAQSYPKKLWHEFTSQVAHSLRNNQLPNSLTSAWDWYAALSPEREYYIHLLSELYTEMHSRTVMNSDTFFCYKASHHTTSRTMVFEKLSDIEVLEYAIHNLHRPNACMAGASDFLHTHPLSTPAERALTSISTHRDFCWAGGAEFGAAELPAFEADSGSVEY